MDERLYRFLKWTAILLGVAFISFSLWESFVHGRAPGDTPYLVGDQFFEDGRYAEALAEYERALTDAPDHLAALRGRARSLLQLGRLDEAQAVYAVAIEREPDFSGNYANRGVLNDRMGRYEQAIADYEKALALDPELAEGVHWLTRFMRNQPDKPPTIADRAAYLRAELAKPPGERVLRVPEVDEAQRSFKQ